MKKTLFSAVAVLALVGPLALSSASAQSGQDRRDNQYQQGQHQERDNARDGDNRDRRGSWREDRRDARWDGARHNGYYDNDRWTYGPPPANYYGRPGFSLGYQSWERGQRLGYYNGRFQDVNYRSQGLRAPPRGYHWVSSDRGDFLLVARRDGRILQVVAYSNDRRDRRDRRQAWREDRRDARWDESQYNGYYDNDRWSYGAPPSGRRDVVYGYRPWEPGQRLGYYESRYQEVDYRSNRSLRQPPRGYHWVRNDGGDYLLAAIAGGLIAEVILNSGR